MPVQPVINIHAHLNINTDAEEMIATWRKQGAMKVCVLAMGRQLATSQGYFTNDMLLEKIKKHPDLIAGMGYIELNEPFDPVDKIDQLKEQGFAGLKFMGPTHYYSDECYFPFYERAEQLDMPIIFHVGMVMADEKDKEFKIYAEWMRAYTLDRIARSFPNLKLIAGHFGDPHWEEAFKVSTRHVNVYACPSGAAGSNIHISKCKKALAPFPGADWDNPEQNQALIFFRKFAFGTDNPPIDHWVRQSEDLMDYLHIPQETRDAYYWKNAAKIFGWTF